jgi:hypothetical protein
MNKSNSLLRELLVALVLTLCVSSAAAKLPVPEATPESQAKAEEAKSKAAAAAKKAAELLGSAQDKAVANYKSRAAK